jgi:hypothetical protein
MIQITQALATAAAINIPSARATITRITLPRWCCPYATICVARPSRSPLQNQASDLGNHLSATHEC